MRNLKHMVDYAAEQFGDTDFLQYKTEHGIACKSYKEFKAACDSFSLMLESKNLKNAHVAVVGPTSFEWIVSYFGCANSGGVAVPLAPNETVDMNCRLMDFADVDVLVFDAKSKPLYEQAKKLCSKIKLFISSDNKADENAVNMADLLNEYEGEYTEEPDGNDLCAIVFTSGTTGFPKGVMLTHRNLVYSATSVHVACPTTKMFCCLPIHHAFCFTANITKSICKGKTVCVNDNLANVIQDLRLFKPDSIVAVPQLVKKIMGGAMKYAAAKPEMNMTDAVQEFLGGNIIDVISGGAPLEAQVNAKFNSTGILVLNGYGMTECSPIISNNAVGSFRHGSAGKPIPCMQVKIEDGEILVKGPSVMKGYYKNPEATAAAFTEDGWLHTGDLGHFDDDGFLYVTGRSKNLILLDNGENVSAEMLEEKFANEPLVQEVVCFGDDGAIYAEVYLNQTHISENNITDTDNAMKELLMRVNSSLAVFQRISGYIIRESPFERTASSKIKRGNHGKIKKAEAVLPSTPNEEKVYSAVKELLVLSQLSMEDNFFAIGGNSLTAVELALSLNIKPQTVYDKPFLVDLAQVLDDIKTDAQKRVENINSLIAETKCEEKLPEYKCVLLTGATGFLGIHILKELIDKKVKVYCLVRDEKRLKKQIEYYFGELDLSDVSCVIGNIEEKNLGLSEEVYSRLCKEIDCVFHVAANVHHAGDYQDLERTNVIGTKNVIEFCFGANAVLQHTSTVSVHGAATVIEKYANAVFTEDILDIGQHYWDNVYIHSKYCAEEVVLLARQQGLKANIYRIGNLTWRASDGKFQINQEDNGFLHRIHAMLKLKMYQDNMDKYPMDLTAVDECAEAFVNLAFLHNANEIYHMYNHNFLSAEDLFKNLGVEYRYVSTAEMIETAMANMDDRDIHVYMFYMIISGRSSNVEMKNSFTLERLKETGFEWSKPDAKYLTVTVEDASKGHCLDFEPCELKSMRTTGSTLTPIQKLTLGVLKGAEPSESKLFEGDRALFNLAEYIKNSGYKKPFIITLEKQFRSEYLERFIAQFEEKTVFDKIYGEPTVSNTDETLSLYILNKCDCVIAVGGGSVIDTAKITALRAANSDSDIEDICKLESFAENCVPLFVAPTTAGTGSEVTLFAVATEEEDNKKRPFVSDKYIPTAVALDAELTVSVPRMSTAFTGIDALSHAVEAFVSTFSSSFEEDAELSFGICKEIFKWLPVCCNEPYNLEARAAMQKAAFNAGLAFRRIGTGYIHAIAHRLGEFYHIPHGLAIAAVFTGVLRAYQPYSADKCAKLSFAVGVGKKEVSDEENANAFFDAVDNLIASLGIETGQIPFKEADLEDIVRRAQDEAKVIGYPRPFSDERLAEIIKGIFE